MTVMKEKSGNHKATNTFRFQSFNKRVQSLKVNSRKFILSRESDEEIQSELSKTIEKWQELNLHEEFKNFCNDIGDSKHTVPQVLLKEADIAECFRSHLESCNPLALSPILKCLVAFATDTYEIFYEKYFFTFIPQIMQYSTTKKHDTIEDVFVCLTSLFVVLQKHVKQDMLKLMFEYQYLQFFTSKHPWYINELASQSISFIVRKLPNKKQFFEVIFEHITNQNNLIDGISRLIFNACKSDVVRRLHHSTKTQLAIIIEVMETVSHRNVVSALKGVMTKLARHITASKNVNESWKSTWLEDSNYVWPVFYDNVAKSLNNENDEFLSSLLNVYQSLLEHQNCALLLDVNKFVTTVPQILSMNSNKIVDPLLKCIQKIFVSELVTGDQLDTLLTDIFSSKLTPTLLFPFVEYVASLDNFDSKKQLRVLEYIQDQCEKNDSVVMDELISTIASILMQRCSPIRCAKDCSTWSREFLDFDLIISRKCPSKTLLNHLENRVRVLKSDFSNVESIILSSICIQHLKDGNKCAPLLFNILKATMAHLNSGNSNAGDTEILFFLLGMVVETLFHICSKTVFSTKLMNMKFDKLLKTNAQCNIHYLKAFDLYLTSLKETHSNKLSIKYFDSIYTHLSPTLAGSHPVSRMICADILSLFDLPCDSKNKDTEYSNLFKIFLQIEETPIDPFHFKERIRLMNIIDADHLHQVKPQLATTETAVVQFLVGQLRINYRDLWSGVMQNIAGHAKSLPNDIFWPHWKSILQIAAKEALQELHGVKRTELVFESENIHIQTLYELLVSHDSFGNLTQKQSALEFRNRLWTAMLEFTEVCENNSDDLVHLFQDYVLLEVKLNQNLTVNCKESCDDQNVKPTKSRFKPTQLNLHSFYSHAALFSKFRNLKSIDKTRKLQNVFEQFLSHSNPKTQKIALDAIMATNPKFLKPYREFLYNLLDDKTMKDELVLFKMDGGAHAEKHSLQSQHRMKMIPIVLKILYGRKQVKGTTNNGKCKSSMRRSAIMRFLGKCNAQELNSFFNHDFEIFNAYTEDDILTIVEKALNNTNHENVINPKCMIGAFNSLAEIMDSMGNLLSDQHPLILKIMFFILATTTSLCKQDAISAGFLVTVKKLKKIVVHRIISFFQSSVLYPWSAKEIDALFMVFVIPSLNRIDTDAVTAVPTVLRLMEAWSDNHRYHVFFSKIVNDKSVFDILLQLFCKDAESHMDSSDQSKCRKRASTEVFDTAMKIIKNLLSPLPVVQPHHIVAPDLPISFNCEVESIAVPSIGRLIVHRSKNLLISGLKSSLSSKNTSETELFVLEEISPWISDPETANELVELLLGLLVAGIFKKDSRQKFMLNIVKNLATRNLKPKNAIAQTSALFSKICDRECRSILCEIINEIALTRPEYSLLNEWCQGLNSWHVSKLDEMDEKLQFSTYESIRKHLSTSENYDKDVLLFLVHNSFWVMEHGQSLPIQTCSVGCLKNVFAAVKRFYDVETHSKSCIGIVDWVISQLRQSFKNDDVGTRDRLMEILSCAVQTCHPICSRFSELYQLTHMGDTKKDFFSLMCDGQLSKKAHALNTLSHVIKENDVKFSKNTIIDFLIPICSHYLFKDKYSSSDHVVKSAISAIGALAGKLPWINYHSILKYYILMLQKTAKFMKMGIATLEAIIDAFHESIDNSTKNVQGKSVYHILVNDLIPKLKGTLNLTVEQEKRHKSNQTRFPEEEYAKRLPLAFAIIKLLQKLPQDLLNSNLRGIIFKLLNLLKSKCDSVRRQTREMLVKVVVTLGGNYLSSIVKDMSSLMTKGFHHHVMVATLYAILHEVQADLTPSHIDLCVPDIIDICLLDSFSLKTEEKTASHMSHQYPEGKIERGVDIIVILGKTVGPEHLNLLIKKLEEHVSLQNKKIFSKVSLYLHKFANGLEGNIHIDLKTKAIFLHKLLSEKLQHIRDSKIEEQSLSHKDAKIQVADSFIIEPEPRRSKPVPKVVQRVSSNVFVEFCLHLLHQLLRHEKFNRNIELHLQLLNGFVVFLRDCLHTEYPQVCINALHVLGFMQRYDLKNLHEEFNQLFCQLFVILDQFATFKQAKGKSYEMIQLVFKTLALMIAKVDRKCFKENQIRVLLVYARDNLPDASQYHSTFSVLKSILKKKINCPEVHTVMETVMEMSIKNDSAVMLDQARSAYLLYLLDYPKTNKQLMNSWNFYLSNLNYSVAQGRQSALFMVQELIDKYPIDLFTRKNEILCYVQLCKSILQEDSPDLREKQKVTIRMLYEKSKSKEAYLEQALLWLSAKGSKSEVAISIHLASQALLPCLKSKGPHPKMTFKTILPKFVSILQPEKFSVGDDEDESVKIHLALNSALQVMLCLCNLLTASEQFSTLIDSKLWKYLLHHLTFPNVESRLYSTMLLNILFVHYSNCEETPTILKTSEEMQLATDTLCDVIRTHSPTAPHLVKQLGEEVIKALILIMKKNKIVPINLDGNSEEDNIARGAYYILQKTRNHAHEELAKYRQDTDVREAFLKLIAAVVLSFGNSLNSYQSVRGLIIAHIVRELEDPGTPSSVKGLAEEVSILTKDQISESQFDKLIFEHRETLQQKKKSRKRKVEFQKIENPEGNARKKIRDRARNKNVRKRKRDQEALLSTKKIRL